jgi:hypothetical protein
MKIYVIKQPFMTRTGQFEEGKHTLVGGIEVNALKLAGEYRVYIGDNRKVYYDITFKEALEIYRKFGKGAITMRGNKKVFIIPFDMMRSGKVSDYDEEIKKRNNLMKEAEQRKLFY